jgi:hypothetical protein
MGEGWGEGEGEGEGEGAVILATYAFHSTRGRRFDFLRVHQIR